MTAKETQGGVERGGEGVSVQEVAEQDVLFARYGGTGRAARLSEVLRLARGRFPACTSALRLPHFVRLVAFHFLPLRCRLFLSFAFPLI